jgi:hypothetical protein
MLAYVAGQDVELDADELAGARRRALLVLAAGGDPHRRLELDDSAVAVLAGDLDGPSRRAQLAHGLNELRVQTAGFPRLAAALERLCADADLAWRTYAAALLAEELAED